MTVIDILDSSISCTDNSVDDPIFLPNEEVDSQFEDEVHSTTGDISDNSAPI